MIIHNVGEATVISDTTAGSSSSYHHITSSGTEEVGTKPNPTLVEKRDGNESSYHQEDVDLTFHIPAARLPFSASNGNGNSNSNINSEHDDQTDSDPMKGVDGVDLTESRSRSRTESKASDFETRSRAEENDRANITTSV